MQHESLLTVASGRFEAARHLNALPRDHRMHATHGHGFVATAFARLAEGQAPYPGAEEGVLGRQMAACTDLLTYCVLNDSIPDPSDENIARWIRARLDVQAARVAVWSTPSQGAGIGEDGRAHLWRRYRFLAAHQLPNVPAGHKCGRMHGHGFEVMIQVAQDGGPSTVRASHEDLDAMWAPLAAQLEYHCLNDIEGLSNPTSEMLSSWLWARLKPGLPSLQWVSVYETASCGASFDGSHYRIWKDFSIDSAVQFKQAPEGDPRHAIHGDTYTLRLHLHAPLDAVMGWTVDFGDVKAIFAPVFKALDHHPLYERPELGDSGTASIARWILHDVRQDIPQLARVDMFGSQGGGSVIGLDLSGPALPV
ncbi:6-pyruvoyl tetrahydropterin synthase [Pusillimonas sp. TS35]|uniref:6-carboxytetrahydropterin synthase n=1 Tax=Paracandidimonas lactea TaxID=2895524 RepID=UPI00136A8BF1|nr:6-carboxytetrahydropterin synthase [Paracandidimonas lactea]MYN14343.1 6-pyruvoyl tetrahydropterin synthase [Pusillimonas sp. TS35]